MQVHCQQIGRKAPGLKLVTYWLKRLKIKRARFDRYLCVHCHDALVYKLQHGIIPASYLQHVDLYRHQTIQFKLQRELLTPNQLLILYDFSTIHETALFKVKNLSCCVWWNDGTSVKHHYFDFFATAKHDFKYIDYVFKILPWSIWNKLRISSSYKQVSIWSDGGTKSNNSLATFSHLSQTWNAAVNLNYYAPHHGHSIVDAHFGIGKRFLRKKFPPPTLIRKLSQVLDVWQQLSNTTSMMLESIPQHPVTIKKIAGIRKWFQIVFSSNTPAKISTFGKTGDQTTFINQTTLQFQ